MKGLRKGGKKRRTVYSRRVRIGRQEDSSSCFLLSLSLSLCASAFVIFSAEKKRKGKGEKKKIGQLLAMVTVLITTNSISFN